jgi:hypothetical protein
MHIEDATAFIVDFLRNPRSPHPDDRPNFGYDIWLSNVIVAYLREVEATLHFPSPHATGMMRAG